MKAPDKVYIHRTIHLGLLSGSEIYITGQDEQYIRKDTLLKWLQKEYETNKWFYDTHAKPNNLHTGRCEAYKQVIDKIESL